MAEETKKHDKQEEPKKMEETKKETKVEEKKVKAPKVEKLGKEDKKMVLERNYVVPLRREWLKVPKYKRANKAVKALKEFIARHMKIYDRDLRKVKVDVYLNNEIRFRGMRKPLHKIEVKAMKFEDGTVQVKLVNIPKHIEFEMARKVRKIAEFANKKASIKPEPKEEKEVPQENAEKVEDTKEKVESSKEAMQEIEKKQAKQAEHSSGIKAPQIQRKVLKK